MGEPEKTNEGSLKEQRGNELVVLKMELRRFFMLLCDEHVERGDDEEGEDGADGLSLAVVRQHPS